MHSRLLFAMSRSNLPAISVACVLAAVSLTACGQASGSAPGPGGDAAADVATGDGAADAATGDGAVDASDGGAADAAGPDAASCNPGQLAVCGRGAAGIDCAISAGSASFGPLVTEQAGFSDGALWNGSPSYYGTIQFPDVDGDGRADVCGRGSAGVDCALSSGASFGALGTWQAGFSDAASWGSAPAYWATIRFPDVDGDGKADVCGRGTAGIQCALSSGQSFAAMTVWQADFSDAQKWGSLPAYWATIQFPDVDGDGKADVCGRGVAGIRCALSDGTAFGVSSVWQADFGDAAQWSGSASYYATIQFPDVNGDGKADVCGRGAGGIRCALSDGTSFGASSVWQADFGDAAGWGSSPAYWATIQFPDVDGDGKADVCGRGVAGIRCAVSDGGSFGTSTVWQPDLGGAADDGGAGGASWGLEAYYATIQFPLLTAGDCPRRRGAMPMLRFMQRLGN